MKKEFTKNDLRTGMIVRFRNGMLGVVLRDYIQVVTGLHYIGKYQNDLTLAHKDTTCNIDEIYEFKEGLSCKEMFDILHSNGLEHLIEKEYVELIWKREEPKREIDWNKVPKWTRVLVRNYNENWKRAYFMRVGYIGYKATYRDRFTSAGDAECYLWDEIKIYDENDMKEEWYK